MKKFKLYDLYIHEVYDVFGVSFYYIDLLILCLLAFGFFFWKESQILILIAVIFVYLVFVIN